MKKINRDVTGPLMDSYIAALWIGKAIEAVNGDVENKDKFHDALQKEKMANSPHGALSVDHGQVVQDMYIRRIDKVNGHYQNTVIYTYPKVNQFFKFDPQTILKSKPYDENNPPCKYCE